MDEFDFDGPAASAVSLRYLSMQATRGEAIAELVEMGADRGEAGEFLDSELFAASAARARPEASR